jgi:uncharacterized SAM-binding protein YcdF (DUF218 family)
MIYYVSKAFWLLAAPTNALVLISVIVAFWIALRSPNRVAWFGVLVACGLVVGTFTPIGLALTLPLEYRFAFSPPGSRAPPDGIILLAGGGLGGIRAVSALSQDYPKARLIFSGFTPTEETDEYLFYTFARLGGDPARIYVETRPRTTSEDALYAAASLKPKPSERWVLVTSAAHMPRAVGCFRVAGFQVEPYPVDITDRSHPFAGFIPGSLALYILDAAAKEWIGLIAYRLMGKTDALFPGP